VDANAARYGPCYLQSVVSHSCLRGLQVLAFCYCIAPTAYCADEHEMLGAPGRTMSPTLATSVWAVAQLLPSPLLVTSSSHVGGGVRWQITPLLYSFGVRAKPFRALIVEPSVRHSGSVELYGSPEWACCAPDKKTSWLVRAGTRLYLPAIERGETLSFSLGGAYYRAAGGGGGSGEVGVYTLYGVLGLTVTLSPALPRREVITALSIRYL
jgi:hypothetical protein